MWLLTILSHFEDKRTLNKASNEPIKKNCGSETQNPQCNYNNDFGTFFAPNFQSVLGGD